MQRSSFSEMFELILKNYKNIYKKYIKKQLYTVI